MDILEELNKELSKVYNEPILEYKKWRRPKEKKTQKLNLPQIIDANITTYNKAINQVLETNAGEEIQDNKKVQISALLSELDNNLDNNLKQTKEKEVINKINKVKENNKNIKQKLKGKAYKKDIRKLLNYMEELLSAKLPKGILRSIALSNPLTAIVYQNFDILKGAYNAITDNRTDN